MLTGGVTRSQFESSAKRMARENRPCVAPANTLPLPALVCKTVLLRPS